MPKNNTPTNLVYPKARLRLLDASYRPKSRLFELNRVNLHSTASLQSSQFDYFNAPKRPSSHLHLDFGGGWEQYQYLDLQSEADYEGCDATWSIETQGLGNEKWTPEQVEALAEFFAWATGHGIPNKIAESSKVGSASHGLSWHRLGIDGNFPSLPDIRAGRLQRGGGMHYSTARGKTCPGDLRIEQIPEIFNRAQQLLTPRTEWPDYPPVTAPKPPEGTDKMYFLARLKSEAAVYFGDGITRRHVKTQEELNDIQYKMKHGDLPTTNANVQVVDRIDWLGAIYPPSK